MNKKVLQKCLAELEKSEPNISYVRGMLETALDMLIGDGQVPMDIVPVSNFSLAKEIIVNLPIVKTEEELFAERYANGPIGKI